MKNYQPYQETLYHLEGIWCDDCKNYYDDPFELQEFTCIEIEVGYGADDSIIETTDGDQWEADLCQRCFFHRVGDVLQFKGNRFDGIKQ